MVKQRVLSFRFAFEGLYQAFKEEPHLKFHFLAGVLAVFLGWFFKVTRDEWLTLIIIISLVISVELTNTAIEAVVDSFTQETHPGAKLAKDISAAAVLVISLAAALVGAIIFLPHLISF